MDNRFLISASILSADFARLGEDCKNVIDAGADWLHFDVMDNHYVPNLTVGPLVCESLRKYGITAPIDVHLMTRPVNRLITDFAKAGATYITFHPEASDNVKESLDIIRNNNCKAGLAFNPDSNLFDMDDYADYLDLILIMSVNPGFAGQSFIPTALNKLKLAREFIQKRDLNIRLSVDGGIKIENIDEVAIHGADTFVAGSAIFKNPPYSNVIQQMRSKLAK